MNPHRPTRQSAPLPITVSSRVEAVAGELSRPTTATTTVARVTAALAMLITAAARRLGGGTRWEAVRDDASVAGSTWPDWGAWTVVRSRIGRLPSVRTKSPPPLRVVKALE